MKWPLVCGDLCSSMMESALFGVVILDDAIVFANHKAASILGYVDPKDLLGKAPLELVHPGDRRSIKDKLEIAASRHVVAGEERFIRRDWSVAFVDVEIFPVSLTRSESVLLLFFRDISMRKATEQSQWESEKKYWELFNAISDGVLVYELGDGVSAIGGVDEANGGLCSMLGYDRSDLLSMDVLDLIDASFRDEILLLSKETMDRGEARFRPHLVARDGTSVTAEISARIVSLWDRPVGMWVVRDISPSVDAEREMSSLNDRYKSLFTHLSDGFALYEVIWDPDGRPWSYRFSEVNEAYERLIGVSRSELIGRMVLEAVPDGELLMLPSCASVAVSGESIRFEHYSASRDIYLDVAVFAPTRSSVAVVLGDITSVKKLEAQVQQSEKLQALGKLTGGVAHDFANYLVGIMSYGATIHERSTDPSARVMGARILDIANRANELIKKLLVFSREGDLCLSSLSLNDVVMDMVGLLEHGWGKLVNIKLGLDGGLPAIVADGGQIYNALMNLVINAKDAMPQGGSVTISTGMAYLDDHAVLGMIGDPKPGRYVWVSVADQGRGIPPRDLSRIFDPFYSTRPQGTGMGLPIVFGTVKAHGGGIRVESSPGKGSVFSVFLPSGVAPEEFGEPEGNGAVEPAVCAEESAGPLYEDLERELILHRPLGVSRALAEAEESGLLEGERLKAIRNLSMEYLFDLALEELKKSGS